MLNDLETYRQTLLNLYLRLPDTPCRVSRHDGRLVQQLWERQIPLLTVETAFLLASVRRAARRPDAIPLGPIRSLHYFLPVIEELLHTPLHHGDTYPAYLRGKVPLRPATDGTTRRPNVIPLGPIRSLHYFLPVIEELLHTPLHHGEAYLAS